MSLIGAAAVGAGGSLLQGLFGNRQQKKNIERQKRADLELANYAYNRDTEAWNRQNEYNSPQAQMGRLKEAGLNPNLIYGSGAATSTGNASTLPKYQSVRTDYSKVQSPVQIAGAIGQTQDFLMKNAQIDLIKEQANVAAAEAAWSNRYFEGRAGSIFERMDALGRKRMMETGYAGYKDANGNFIRMKETPMSKKYDAEIAKTQHSAKSYQIGNQLKGLEVAWYEMLKKAGIGAQLGVPLMKILFSK